MFSFGSPRDPALEASTEAMWLCASYFLSPACLILTFVSCRYLPAIGRFLIVVTFLEDALRIITQWSDQLLYLHDYRHSMSDHIFVKLC